MQTGVSPLALVTGAASGMGEATAQLLGAAGWRLILCDINENALRQSARRYAKHEDCALAVGDISSVTFFAALDAAIKDREINAVIHCAGISPTMGSPERILEVNLAATMRLTDYLFSRMANDSAVILLASSSAHMAGTRFDPQIELADTPDEVGSLLTICPDSGIAYMIAKRGVLLLARRQANRFGAQGVRLVSLSPGIIDTPMGRREMQDSPVVKALVENSSLGRPAHPSEVGAAAVFLCSPAASFITGTDILVDGGSLSRGSPAK